MHVSTILLIIAYVITMIIIITCIILVIQRFRKTILYNIKGNYIHVTIRSDAVLNINDIPYDLIDIDITIANTALILICGRKLKMLSISGKNTQLRLDTTVLECDQLKIKNCFTESALEIFLNSFEILQCRFNGNVNIVHIKNIDESISSLNLIQDVEFNKFTYDSKLCKDNITIMDTLFKKALIHLLPTKNVDILYSHSNCHGKVLYYSDSVSTLKFTIEFCNYFFDVLMKCKLMSLVNSRFINSSFKNCIVQFKVTNNTLIQDTSFEMLDLVCEHSKVFRIQSCHFNNIFIKSRSSKDTVVVNNIIDTYMSFVTETLEHTIVYGNIIKQLHLPKTYTCEFTNNIVYSFD